MVEIAELSIKILTGLTIDNVAKWDVIVGVKSCNHTYSGQTGSISVPRGLSPNVALQDMTPFVRASRPPNGATAFGPRPESAVIMAIMPSSAAIRG